MCKVIGYDSFSELPGIHLGTCWTVRIAMLFCPDAPTKRGGGKRRRASVCVVASNFESKMADAAADGGPDQSAEDLTVRARVRCGASLAVQCLRC